MRRPAGRSNDSKHVVAGPRSPVASRLLGIAAQLFWRNGYAGTTTRALSETLGVKRASLYHHIEKKEDLLYAICVNALQNILSRARAGVTGAESSRDRVEGLIHGHLTGVLQDKSQHATMLTELRALSSDRREQIVAMRGECGSFVEGVVREGPASGALGDGISAMLLDLGV